MSDSPDSLIAEPQPAPKIEERLKLPHVEDELTILRDKKLWEQDESFQKVPDMKTVLAYLEGKTQGQIAREMYADKEMQAKLHAELRIDDLTGLPNAKGFRERTKAELNRRGREGAPFLVCSVDANNMQEVNKSPSGHDAGNAYIQLIGQALASGLRPSDIPAAVHGDEMLIVAGCDEAADGDVIRNRLYKTVQDKVAALSPEHPLYTVRESVQLEAAIGTSYQTWTEEELKLFKEGDKESITHMIAEKMDRALYDADVDMYEQKAIQKGKATGKKNNETRKSENTIVQNRHLWFVEDPPMPLPTEEEVFANLTSKSQEQIAQMIIEDKQKILSLQEQQTTDEMTGLLNRNGLRRRVKEAVTELARTGGSFSLMFGDVNEMKVLNDLFGHAAGDAAIILVAQAVKESIRGNALAAHPYGDENVIFLPNTTPEDTKVVRARIYERIDTLVANLPEGHPLYKAKNKLKLGGSFGISHRTLTEAEIQAFKEVKGPEEQGALVRDIVSDEVVNADINMQIEKRRMKAQVA